MKESRLRPALLLFRSDDQLTAEAHLQHFGAPVTLAGRGLARYRRDVLRREPDAIVRWIELRPGVVAPPSGLPIVRAGARGSDRHTGECRLATAHGRERRAREEISAREG